MSRLHDSFARAGTSRIPTPSEHYVRAVMENTAEYQPSPGRQQEAAEILKTIVESIGPAIEASVKKTVEEQQRLIYRALLDRSDPEVGEQARKPRAQKK